MLASSAFAGGTEPAALDGVVVLVNMFKRRPTGSVKLLCNILHSHVLFNIHLDHLTVFKIATVLNVPLNSASFNISPYSTLMPTAFKMFSRSYQSWKGKEPRPKAPSRVTMKKYCGFMLRITEGLK